MQSLSRQRLRGWQGVRLQEWKNLFHPAAQSLQDLRTSARLPAEVWYLPFVLPWAGSAGRNSRSLEVELVVPVTRQSGVCRECW